MVFAGKKTSKLKTDIANNILCPNCNKNNTTNVSVIGVYKHIFHIPFLAGKKFGVSNCQNCNHQLRYVDMPSGLKLAYYELKETVKTPLWFYAGLIGIKTLVLIKIFSKYF
jgi:hypothetical protein